MVLLGFLAMGSSDISKAVDTKLTNYNYIYPSVPGVCILSSSINPF
jgi:hypothetical protein